MDADQEVRQQRESKRSGRSTCSPLRACIEVETFRL